MLDPNALSAAIAVAQSLGSKNIMLSVVGDTPLSALVRETPVLGLDAASTDYASLTTALVDLSRDPVHSQSMQEIVQLSASTVRRVLDFTRNTVMPHLRAVIDAHGAALAAMAEAPLPFDINVVYQPEVYKTEAARSYLERWENSPAMSAPAPTNLGVYSPEEILQLAQLTDDGGFNASMEKLLNSGDGRGIVQIQNILKGIDSVNSIEDIFALALTLVLNNIDAPKEGVAMTMANYNSIRAVMAQVSAKKGLTLILRLQNALNLNAVYMPGFLTKGTINLCGEVYRLLLEKGLTAEVLIGNELLNRKYRALELLNEAAVADCMAVYERDRTTRQNAHLLNKRAASRKIMMDELRKDQQRIAAEGNFTVDGDSAEKSWGRLKDVMDRVLATVWADTEPTVVIAAVLCATWYAHTDSARLIDIMFDVEKTNPGLPPKEIATLATLRYISAWVGSQIVVVDSQPTA